MKISVIERAHFITGQAFVDLAYAKEGTPIAIYQGGVMDRPAHPQRTEAGGGEGGESVREVVVIGN